MGIKIKMGGKINPNKGVEKNSQFSVENLKP